MRTYLVEYIAKRNECKQKTVKSDMLINAYQTFIETYKYKEIVSIKRIM